MRRLALWALVFCVFAQFGGCKSSTVSEVALAAPPQTRPRMRGSRDYIFCARRDLSARKWESRSMATSRFGRQGVLFLFRQTAGTVPDSLRESDLDGL